LPNAVRWQNTTFTWCSEQERLAFTTILDESEKGDSRQQISKDTATTTTEMNVLLSRPQKVTPGFNFAVASSRLVRAFNDCLRALPEELGFDYELLRSA
jgi:hypothetical protein